MKRLYFLKYHVRLFVKKGGSDPEKLWLICGGIDSGGGVWFVMRMEVVHIYS
jgi:hypothetical protein